MRWHSDEMAVGGRENSSVGAVSSLEGLWSPVRVPPHSLARGLSGCRKWSLTVHLGSLRWVEEVGDKMDGRDLMAW